MASRFYLLEYKGGRKIVIEDFGNVLKMGGILYQGMGRNLLLLLPSAVPFAVAEDLNVLRLTEEEWSEIIRATDDPSYFEDNDLDKTLHRKARMAVSGAVQQMIWVRDALMCLYCGKGVEDVQLTVDHFVPLELGGANKESNYVTACRRCNKEKGNMHPAEFCAEKDYDYQGIVKYLNGEMPLHLIMHLSHRLTRVGRFKLGG